MKKQTLTQSIKKIGLGFFIGITLYSVVTPLRAEFRVCNATQSLVGVALGYRDDKGWHSEGWWRLSPSYCETVLEGPLKARYYYLHVEDTKNEGQWSGPIFMCVKDEQFLIDGVENCYVRGYQRAGFQEIDTGVQTRWTVQLVDKNNINEIKALSNEERIIP